MKARKLRKVLNDTNYIIHQDGRRICVGGPYCDDLISVDMETLEMKTAVHIDRGRAGLRGDELKMIWDKLTELIDNGGIKDIIEGGDEIENPLTVYAAQDGELKERVTDEYGWPNVTDDGFLMYENQYFRSKEEAIRRGIADLECQIISSKRLVDEYADKLVKHKDLIKESENRMRELKRMQGFSCSNCGEKGCRFPYPPGDYHCFVPIKGGGDRAAATREDRENAE
jgi:hypothetical protein